MSLAEVRAAAAVCIFHHWPFLWIGSVLEAASCWMPEAARIAANDSGEGAA